MEITTKNGYKFQIDESDIYLLINSKWYGVTYKKKRVDGSFGKARSYIIGDVWDGKQVNRERLHRMILNATKGIECDHINGDTLDNRRSNLRLCTHSENGRNRGLQLNSTSGYKGVYFHKHSGTWHARIKVNQHTKSLRYFHSKEEAALAYNKAALEYFGEFARLNELKSR